MPKFCVSKVLCHTVHVHERWLTWSRTSSLLVEAIMTTPSSGLMPAGMLSKLENHKWKLCNMNTAYAESLTHSVIALIKVDLSWQSALSALNNYCTYSILLKCILKIIINIVMLHWILKNLIMCVYIMWKTYSRKVWWEKVWQSWQIICNLLN